MIDLDSFPDPLGLEENTEWNLSRRMIANFAGTVTIIII